MASVAGGAGACGDAITLAIASDRPIPTALDAVCVGVADRAASGGQFGQGYQLTGALATLPQTLRVEAGGASAAFAWVRGDRGGVPVASASAPVDFGGDVTLALPACAKGPAAAPAQIGAAVGPGGARLAASQGPGGEVIVAVTAGAAAIVGVTDRVLGVRAGPAVPAGAVVALLAVDIDGDCDDDIVVATAGAAPELWRRDGADFVDAGPVGAAPMAALAAADVDGDGDADLVLGGGSALELWRNDGGGDFTLDAAALAAAGRVTAVRAVALGDLDGDGVPDLVVGQAGGPLEAWLGQAGGAFLPADAAVPAVPLDVARLTLVDADGDFDPDLVVAVRGAAMRLYVDRDGRLEDQSFVRLPQPAPVANAVAVAGWDDGCEPDAVVASDAGGLELSGTPCGALASEGTAPSASYVVMVDLDGDGAVDAVLATPGGVVWLAR